MNPFPVFLASNNKYAPLLASAIMSIAENTSSAIAFHIFNDNISPSAAAALQRLAKRYGMPLAFHEADLRAFRDCPSGWFKTNIVYARYAIADLFPQYDQALYVDADMIFTEDIMRIPRLAPTAATLAACADMGISSFVDEPAHKTALGIRAEHKYFNNGLLLINCIQWRKERIASELLRIAHDKSGLLKCPSQDPMNIYFSPNHYFLLPQRFNYMPAFDESGQQIDGRPAVIHFTERKPWGYPGDPYAIDYWKYAVRGPFLLETLKRYFTVKGSRAVSTFRRLARSSQSALPRDTHSKRNET